MLGLFTKDTGYKVAKARLGQHEVRDRSSLIKFFKDNAKNNDIVVDPSTTPWCACFVNACERAVGKAGNGRQNARSFLTYGQKVSIADAKQGDILIFKRGGSSWQGHVTYLDKIVKDSQGNLLFQCLGGNQSDSVSIGWYSGDRLLGIRRS